MSNTNRKYRTFIFTFLERDGVEFEVEVEGEITRGIPATFNDPGEYEEVEIVAVRANEDGPNAIKNGDVVEITLLERRKLEEKLSENAHARVASYGGLE